MQLEYEQREDLSIELIDEYLSMLKAQDSFYEFVKQAWPYVEGHEVPYVDGWFIQALCEHLEAVYRGDIRNMIVNMPPRCMKSILISVMFPAWIWINSPTFKFVYASYGSFLSQRDSVRCRRLINSHWYQRRWGHLYKLVGDQNTKTRFNNSKNGYRITSSIGGSSTGEGGDLVVWEDPNNAKDGESEVLRERTNDLWSQSWASRLCDFRTGRRIISQQRLNQRDASGYVMEKDSDNEWVRFILPMEFESDRRCRTIILPSSNGKVWEDPRQKEGELLWPERIGEKELKSLKNELYTAYRIAGQLQQRPAPSEGAILRKSWFKWWKKDHLPQISQVIQSWDTAFGGEDRTKVDDLAYSACTTWGVFEDEYRVLNLILLGMWRGRVEWPELRETAQKLYRDYRNDGTVEIIPDGKHVPDMVIVEAKANGSSLVQDLRRSGVQAFGFVPTAKHGDKINRVRFITPMIEGGRVWLQAKGPNYTALRPSAHTFVELCAIFPASDARDVVDTMTQVIIRMTTMGYLTHPKDERRQVDRSPPPALYGVDGRD